MKSFFVSFLTLILAVTSVVAQQTGDVPRIPADPEVRVGKLENGMTYYIRHNSKPEGLADFWIYHDVGAIQEEDSQTGLAHFLEHMAFNGTKNMPGKEMINWLETIGVKFGTNLNAMTGVEMTMYLMQQVPVSRESVIDSALLILHDWSHFITLDPNEIDNERGVIIEELRQGNSGQRRVQERNMPVLYNGNRYAHRNVIGYEDHLRTFPRSEIVDFYHRWYRPDMQAIVIVGDIDVDQIEQKIKATMADIPAVENPEAKVPMPIAGNEEPMIRVDSDPELTGTALSFIIKHEAFPTELNDALPIYALRMMINAANSMLNTRLSEMAQETNSPFLGSQVGYSGLSAYNDAFVGSVSARNGELGRAFEAFYTELEKARRYGFSESELERVKTNSLVAAQRAFEARGDRRSGDFVQTYINNFSKNSPMPSAETSWELSQMLIPSLDVKQINELFKQITPYNNTVILAQGPDIKQLPTEEELAAIIEKVKAADIEAYEDTTIDEPLMTRKIKAGKVKKSEKGMYGSTIWTLSNGVKVILKPTDFRVDQISMSGRAKGGLSTISDDDYISGSLINNVVGASGLGKFSNIEMGKLLTGKVASSGASIGGYSTSVSGSSSKKDIETMLQLVNMRFIEPRWNREDFDRLMDRLEVALKNQEGTPDFKLQQEVTKTLYGTGVRVSPLTLADMDKVSFEKMAPIYAKMFANASDFTFTFVGDFDMETLKPLVEKYLGSLPAKGPKMKDKDDGTRMVRGQVENRFKTEMQAPKSTVLYVYSGDIEYNLENNMTMTFLKDALSNRYHESIREEKGGTYGVGVSASLGRNPIETYSMQVSFETDPKMVDELVVLVEEELQKIAENGPLADDLAKTKEFLVKNRPEQLKSNGTWAGYLMTYYTENDDFYTDYDRLLNEMDGKKVQALAQKILRDGNLAKIIMDPEQ